MDDLKKLLDKYLNEYKAYQAIIANNLEDKLDGSLGIIKREDYILYYHITKEGGKKRRRYISNKNLDFVKKLANQTYLKSIENKVDIRIKNLEKLLDDINQFDLQKHISIYQKTEKTLSTL